MGRRKIQKIVEFVSYEFQPQTYFLLLFLIIYFFIKYILQSRKIPTRYIQTLPLILGSFGAFITNNLFQFTFQFNQKIFYTFILPPIIFNLGYSIKISSLSQNFKYVIILSSITMLFKLSLFFIICYMFTNSQNFQTYFQKEITFKQIIIIGSIFCLSNLGTISSPFNKWRNGTLVETFVYIGLFINIYSLAIYRGFFRQLVRLDQKTPYIFLRFVYEVITSSAYYFFFSVSVGIILGILFKAIFRKPLQSYYELPLLIITICSVSIICDLIALQGGICLLVLSLMINFHKPQFSKKTNFTINKLAKISSQLAEVYTLIYLGIQFYQNFSKYHYHDIIIDSLLSLCLIGTIEVLFNIFLWIILKFTSYSLQSTYCWINGFSSFTKGPITLILCLQLNRFNYMSNWLIPIAYTTCFFTYIIGVILVDPTMQKLGIVVKVQQQKNQQEYQNINFSSGTL